MTPPVVIFGATGGVGSALARRLKASGRDVFLAARDEVALIELADELGAPYSVCDVLDRGAIEKTVEMAAADGALSGLVYAVGSIGLAPLRRLERHDFLQAFELNALGAAEAAKAAHKALRAGEGGIVLFSTIAVAQGFANHAAVSMAKGAVEGLTVALAAEFAPAVRVNCVAPSLMKTKMAAGMTSNEQMAKAIAGLHALPRLGEADDAAAAAEYLLSPGAGWMTGQILHVDGGRSTVRAKG